MAAYAAVVSVMNIIDNLELHPHPPISLHKKQAESLTQKLPFLEEFLQRYNPHLAYTTEVDPLESRIANAAYAAEDAIESHIVDHITCDGVSSEGSLYEALEKVIEEMESIEKMAMEIKHELHTKPTPPDSLRSSSIGKKSGMVGADEVLLQLKEKLTSHWCGLQIIPIVGMGGTGKTTLATSIYQHHIKNSHFNVCAWATISHEYSIREILTQLLHQLDEEADQRFSESELGYQLYQHLYSRRFLIVIDDMWSIDAWDGVRNYFPDNDKYNSRIVVTTRLFDLASRLSNSNCLVMKPLDEVDSWKLLSKTVFGEKDCPLELEGIGKRIGNNCKGLPLSIVVVGGLLAKSKHLREVWECIEKNLNSIVNLEDDERCLKILHLSYKQLPVYLKPCFLYMGVFSEDEVIPISKLIKLWVAEGFLKQVSGKGLEEIAKEYLKDLISRNLILIHELGSTGNIKWCKIHDLLRDMCLREAEKERFYTLTPQGIENGQRRFVVSESKDIKALSSMSLARSLILNFKHHQQVPPLGLRLLRVLDSLKFGFLANAEFLENMHRLVNSRFLAFSAESEKCEFPCSIWLLWNIQTLIGKVQEVVTVPTDIWYMRHIRHIQFIKGLHLPDPPNNEIVLENLQTLERVRNFKCSEQVVKRIPNIRKLHIYYTGELDVDDDMYCLANLGDLDKLASLRCSLYNLFNPHERYPVERRINFPHSLKKLVLELHGGVYLEDVLDKIGALRLLEKLTLSGGLFREGQWQTTEGQFHSLKFLHLIYFCNLKVWETKSSHFPCLEHLSLYAFMDLKDIPSEFAEISTLKELRMDCCSDSAMVSGKTIAEEHERFHGEATLQVRVHYRWVQSKPREELKGLASHNFHVTCSR